MGLIPGLVRSPRGGNGNPLQYSCREIPWTEKPDGVQSMGLQSDITEATENAGMPKGNMALGDKQSLCKDQLAEMCPCSNSNVPTHVVFGSCIRQVEWPAQIF